MVLVTKTAPAPVIPAAAPAVQKQAPAPKAPAPITPALNRLTPVPPGMVFPGVPEAPPAADADWLRQNSRPAATPPAPTRTGSPALDAGRDAEWLAAAARPAGVAANFDTGALDTNPETEARNAAINRTGIGEPLDGVLPETLSRRDSHIVTTRELAGAVATGETLRETIAANETRVADLSRRLSAINQYATQNPVAAREMSTFGNIVTRPMTATEAAAMLQSQIDDVRQQTTEAQAELTANAADRDALTRRLLEGETRQTRGAAAFNAGLAALAQTGTETLRGLGIGADMVEYLLTGDTTDNALVTAMDDAREYMSRVLPVDRNGFFTNLASGAGSFAGFMTAGFAAKAISGGSRLLQGLTVGTLGGAQQGAAQADMAMEGTIGQEIARLQFNNPSGVNDEQIAALEDALAIVRYQSFLAGFGLGMTELVPIDRIIARAERASGGALSQRLRNAAAGGFEEGLQEFFQTSTSDAIQQALADPDHPIDWEGAAGAAVIGFLLGTGAGGVLVNVNGREVRVEDLARERNIPPGAAPGTPGPSPAVTPPPEGVPEGAEPADTLYPAPETVAPAGTPSPAGVGPSPVGPAGVPGGAPAGVGGGPAGPATVVASPAVPPVAGAPAAAGAPAVGAPPIAGGAAPATPVVVRPDSGAPAATVPAAPVPVVGAGIAGGLGAAAAQPQPVTQHQRAQLAALGYTPAVIRTMTPAMAQEAIVQGRPAQEGALTAQPTAANADEWLAANSRPVNWTPPAGVKSPEAPNVAVQPSPTPAEPAAAPPADAGRVPDGGGVSGVAAAPAGVGGGVAGGPVPPGGQNARVGASVQNVGKLPARRRSLDLLQFIASIGGIRPGSNLLGMDADKTFLPGHGKFVRPNGRDDDTIRELVAEAGYFGTGDRTRAVAETTIDDLHQLIARAKGGERITPDDADDMAFEAEANLSAEHEKYLDRLEGELRAWMQDYDFDDDAAWLRAMVKVADESSLMYGFSAEDFESVYTRAAVLLADRKMRKVVSYEIPFDLHPEDVRAAAAGAGSRNLAPGGGESVGSGRPDAGEAPAAGGGGQGQAAQGLGATAENPDAGGVGLPKPPRSEGADDSVRPDADLLREATDTTAFRKGGLYGLDVPRQRAVLASVFRAAKNPKVLKAVVESIPVDVVDVLGGGKFSAESIFNNEAVFSDLLAVNGANPVALGVDAASALVSAVTHASAVGPLPSDIARESENGGTAASAGDGNHPANIERTPSGEQYTIPGAEQISDAEYAQNLANKPLRPAVDQKPADDGLFGDSAAQMDLVDMAKAPAPKAEAPAAEPAAEGPRLTAEGPWDFEATYPDIDRKQYERLLNEKPDPFDAAGEPTTAQITEMIDAILSDLQGRHTAILRAQEAAAKAKPAGKKEIEARVAGLFEAIKGLGEEMRGIWPEPAVDAILAAGRKRAVQGQKGVAPKPAEAEKPAFVDEQAAQVKESKDKTETILGVSTLVDPSRNDQFAFKSWHHQTVEWDKDGYPTRTQIIHAATREEYEAKLREAQAARPAATEAAKPATKPNRIVVETGAVFRTPSGRTTSPVPKLKGVIGNKLKQVNVWLLEEAKKEVAGGDPLGDADQRRRDFQSASLAAINLKNLSQSDKDTMNMVLFGDVDGATEDMLVKPGDATPSARPAPQPAPNASWVIKNKATGEVVMETSDQAKVDALNTEKYVAVPIKEHLASLNRPSPAASGDLIFGKTWAEIQAMQKGGSSGRPIDVSKPVRISPLSESDHALMQQHGSIEALKAAGFHGVAERVEYWSRQAAGAVEMTADVEDVTFHETPIPADVRNAWYIATGEKGAMFTLRQRSKSPDGGRVIDAYIANLSRDKQEAIRKAKQHVKAAHRSSTPDPIYWGAPEVLNDIEVGAGGSGSSGSAVEMPTEMVDPIAAAGLAVKALTAKSGRTYWAATGDLKKHEAILDQLGFAPLRKINNVWQRSYFTSDPTAALAEALTTGKAPLKEPAAPLPVKDEGPAIDPDVAKAILAKAKIVVTADKGGFVVTGKTFDIKSEIKEAGGRWDGAAKGWRFSNDPTQKLATLAGANAGANAGADGAGDAGTGIDPADDARLRAAREREDARADERVADASRLVSDESKELIRRGLKFGIPTKVVNEQIEDVGMIVNARERKKPMFLLANEAGTGKTFVMGAAIRELRNRGQKRFVYVTQSQDLIAQIQRDLAPYGLEGVEFATYSKMPDEAKGAVILFDETHNIKNLAGSQRGKNGADLIAQADFTVFASATPFQNPVEAKYLEATGIYGQHEDAHSEWAKMYGAAVRRRKFYNPTTRREQVEEIVYWPGRGKKKDGAAARQWFFKQGVMTQRAMQIDPGMVDVAFTRAPVAETYVKLYKDIEAAYETVLRRWTDEQGNSRDYKITSEVARHRETTIKRVLEAAKGPAAIARAKEIIAEGKNVVLFVETKAERTIGKFRKSEHFKEDTLYTFPEMQKLMEAWAREAEAARGRQERPPPQPFASFIYEIARGMHDHGILHELPSVADDFMEAMGGKEKVAVYTGAVAQAAARKNKEDFLSGKKKVLVATMAKGGTGLSLHDTVGNRETVQLNINLPWAAWQVDQVSARVARYGLKSKAKIEWMFASNIDWETTKLAPRVGARMEAMGAIVKGIEVKAAEKLLGDFDFEGDVDVKQDSGNTIDVDAADGYTADDDIYANAARLERGRVKASDTSGGFFETPYPLAALMTRVAGIRPGDKVLEPSAGTGNLLEFIPTDAKVTAIEVRRENHDKLNERLRRRGVTARRTFLTDFVEWSEQPGMTPDAKDFDVVLMNPPFEREAGVGALDVAHVERAYGLLKPGGRLVAIMGEGSFFRQTKQEAAFREWLDDVGATVIKLPENAFKKSGTGVRARMVVIDKDRPGGRSTIDLADMESASLRGIELTIPSRPSEGMGMMEEWDRLGLGGMEERDRKDRGTTDLFAQPPKPVAPAAGRWPVPKKEPVDSRGRVVLGAFDPKGLPLGEAAQEYVVQQGKALGVEFFVAFDAAGKVVGHQYGTLSASGQLVETTLAFEEPNAAVVTHHNHPSSRAPSLPDLLHLSHEGHAEMWVHAHNGSSWRLSLTPQARQQWRDTGHFAGRKNLGSLGTYPRPALTILGAYNEAVQPIARGVGPAYRAGKIAVDDRDNVGQFYMIEAFRRAGVIDVETNAFVAPDVLEAIAPDIEAAINEAADAISQRVFGHAAGKGSTARRDGGRPGDVRHVGGVGVVLGGSRGGPVGRSVSTVTPSEREAADSQPQGGQGLNQPVFHGSGKKGIKKFLMSFIGTGEGNASFGWGFYAAKAEGTGTHYRTQIGGTPYYEFPGLPDWMQRGRNGVGYWNAMQIPEAQAAIDALGIRPAIEALAQLPPVDGRRPPTAGYFNDLAPYALKYVLDSNAAEAGLEAFAHTESFYADDWEKRGANAHMIYERRLRAAIARALIPIAKRVKPGALYRLEIPDDDVMLDWDKPFREQPPTAQAALRDIKGIGWAVKANAKGGDLYEDMVAQIMAKGPIPSDADARKVVRTAAKKDVSLALLAHGVKGIKFLDQISRAAGEGTHNYVIFDENAIEVVEELEERVQSFGEDGGDQTQTAAFKKWFGASKVVDTAGNPLRVYHGTGVSGFDVFKAPAFFTPNRPAANFYTDRGQADAAGVYPAYLSIKAPLDARGRDGAMALIGIARRAGTEVLLNDSQYGWTFDAPDIRKHSPYDGESNINDLVYIPRVREQLAKEGYDGVVADDVMGNAEIPVWVPLADTQIKSATGNNGAFDPSNPSIIASQRTAPVVRPERRTDTAVIANNIQAIVTRLLGRRIRVDFSDTIEDTATDAWDQRQREIAVGGRPLTATAGGQYSHNPVAPARSFLRLALADPNYDPTDSAYHEAWHHIEMALTNGEERDLLRRDITSTGSGIKRLAAEHLRRTGFTDDVNLMPAYEVTAIAFEGYARMRRAAQPVGPLHIGIRRFFDGIMELLERIKVMLGRRGIRTWEDVFEAAYRGDFRNRTPVSAWAEVTGAAEQIAKYGSMSDEGQAEFNSQPGTNPFDRGGAQARQATLNKQLSLRQPLDRVLRIPFDLFGGMNRKGEWKPGLFITKKARTLIRTSRFSDTGRFRFLNTILHKTRANLSDRYGLDPDYIERDRMRGLDERATLMEGAEVIETLAKAKVGSAEAKILQAVLNGEAVTDAQMEALAQPIRMAIDALGQEAVELGLLSAESFERNRGAYLHRVYMKHESGQNGLVKFVNNIKASNRKRIIGAQFKGRGLWQEVPATELTEGKLGQPPVKGMTFRMLDLVDTDGQGILPDTLEGKKARVARRVYIPAGQPVPARYAEYQDRGVWEVRGFRNGKPVLWRDYTKAEREKMGEITDARYTIAKTFMVMAHDLATGRFYRDIAMNESWAQSKEPLPGTWKDASEYRRFSADPAIEWVRVPETKISKSNTLRYGALAGKYVRAEIWRDLNELAIMQTPTFWNTLLTQWKVNKTARSPVTHMNNVVANLTFMDLNDVGMIDLIGGIKSMVAKDAAYDEAMANGAFGSDMVAQELRNDILAPLLKEIEAQTQGNAGTLSSKIGFLGKFAEALWSAAKAADKGALRLYQLEDEVFRMALYNRRRRQGYPPREAALDARDTFLNYDIRAPLVNAARRTVLPFIAYPYRAIPGIAKAITTHPWKLAKYVSVAYAVNAATYALLGFDDDDEDRERRSLRDSEQGSTWIGLPVPGMGWLGVPRMVRMPWNDAFGNPVFLDIRRWIPAGDVFDLAQSNSAISLPPWLQLGGPLAIAAEIVFNKSLFTGDPLINELTDDMWERGQTVADYLWKAVMPGGPWIPGSWYWEKIVDAATGARDWSGRPYDLASAIASSFGIKLKPQDVENGFALHAFAYEEVERALRAEMNRLGRDAANNQITQAEFERQMAGIIADMERLTERRMETFTGAP